jgi:hypothetical protein
MIFGLQNRSFWKSITSGIFNVFLVSKAEQGSSFKPWYKIETCGTQSSRSLPHKLKACFAFPVNPLVVDVINNVLPILRKLLTKTSAAET